MTVEPAIKDNTELVVQEAKPKLKEPSKYRVIMHNDDFTPMEFVVAVLEMFFSMERALATKIMYEIHMAGKAICGIYSKDVAETKADQVMEYAKSHDHPLLCSVEVM
ncbi:MAG: ATP-dependent Clp protease adapter ClpS [Gammaproteobacteria bacterium]|jgi:ATP-dependent Clp protease adaptor protein ClpS|nr:ATP-dependent Clp protease adapter ClpS [Gammaproteobacteria bacterium]